MLFRNQFHSDRIKKIWLCWSIFVLIFFFQSCCTCPPQRSRDPWGSGLPPLHSPTWPLRKAPILRRSRPCYAVILLALKFELFSVFDDLVVWEIAFALFALAHFANFSGGGYDFIFYKNDAMALASNFLPPFIDHLILIKFTHYIQKVR